MKTAAVPAQITTVEDTVIGSITPVQLALMTVPLCIGFLSYVAFPPVLHFTVYKLGLAILLELIGLVASIRIRGKILLQWAVIVARYNMRPRYYVYDKNDPYLRNTALPVEYAETKQDEAPRVSQVERPPLDMTQVVKLEGVMADPRAKMRFVMGKEGTHVVIHEIKE
ncbi:MAG TPA: hypothetical protein VJP80_02465 [Candidatus Saccharimonadales bacterium]|nr:hypothetical protein [Candidatus Saccharimonadales bacterium]